MLAAISGCTVACVRPIWPSQSMSTRGRSRPIAEWSDHVDVGLAKSLKAGEIGVLTSTRSAYKNCAIRAGPNSILQEASVLGRPFGCLLHASTLAATKANFRGGAKKFTGNDIRLGTVFTSSLEALNWCRALCLQELAQAFCAGLFCNSPSKGGSAARCLARN